MRSIFRVRGAAPPIMRESEGPLRPHARAMRREMTKAEASVWNKLREANRHGHKFRRQHSIPPYIADFVHIRGMLVIEIDGETHGTAEEIAYDSRRDAYLRRKGWNIMRLTNAEVFENVDGVIEAILARLSPHPNAAMRRSTSPAGGRG
jgi:very-short-patch-repair endonuclease